MCVLVLQVPRAELCPESPCLAKRGSCLCTPAVPLHGGCKFLATGRRSCCSPSNRTQGKPDTCHTFWKPESLEQYPGRTWR